MHVVSTAGHVDHGKSTLVERLTGIDPDRFAEEKRRGLTIDLGFAWLTLPSGREVGIIDVPGHERFIKNMLAGAGGAPVCLFVVAANEGWKPQSAEHLAILDVLGVSTGVVAVTKSDLVSPAELDAIVADVGRRLAGSSLRDAAIVPCSARTGEGLEELMGALDAALAAAPDLADTGRARLWIDRVFTIAGAGTVVTGTLYGGRLSVGDEIEIAPEGRRARIRSIQSHKKQIETIEPGSRTALNLVGLDRRGAARGDAVIAPDAWRATRLIDVRLRVLDPDLSGVAHELREKGAHLAYFGTAETPVRLRLLGTQKVVAGGSAYAQLSLRDPLPIGRGDRFVLRDAGRVLTFGGGEVLDPLAPPVRGDEQERTQLLAALAEASPEQALVALVDAYGEMPATEAMLRSGTSQIPTSVVRLGDRMYSSARVDQLTERIKELLEQHHRDRPLETGMPREALRAALDLDPEAFDALLDRVEKIEVAGPNVRVAGHAVELDPQQTRARASLIERLEADGFNPPLAKELAVDPALLRALEEAGEIVRIGDFFLTRAQADTVKERVRSAIESSGPKTVAEIRDLLGTSRKYAVPLCEWLDRTGVTRRQGDERVLGPHP